MSKTNTDYNPALVASQAGLKATQMLSEKVENFLQKINKASEDFNGISDLLIKMNMLNSSNFDETSELNLEEKDLKDPLNNNDKLNVNDINRILNKLYDYGIFEGERKQVFTVKEAKKFVEKFDNEEYKNTIRNKLETKQIQAKNDTQLYLPQIQATMNDIELILKIVKSFIEQNEKLISKTNRSN